MLQRAPGHGLLIPGRTTDPETGRVILRFPTADHMPLTDYLHLHSELSEVKQILRELLTTLQQFHRQMIPESELCLDTAYVRKEDGVLRLLCLPVLVPSAAPGSQAVLPGRNPLTRICCQAVTAALAGTRDHGDIDPLLRLLRSVDRPDLNLELLNWILGPEPEPTALTQPERSRTLELLEEIPMEEPVPESPVREKPTLRERLHGWMERSAERARDPEEPDEWLQVDALPLSAFEAVPKGGRSCVLTVRQTGQKCILKDTAIVIGGDEHLADLWLPHNMSAAREHCRVFPEHGRYYVEDLNTEAGTFRNGERVRMWEPEVLESADIIRIGDDEIVYSERMEAEETA